MYEFKDNQKSNNILMFGLQRKTAKNVYFKDNQSEKIIQKSNSGNNQSRMNLEQQVLYLKNKLIHYQQKIDKLTMAMESQSDKILKIESLLLRKKNQNFSFWDYEQFNNHHQIHFSNPDKNIFLKKQEISNEYEIRKEEIQIIKNSIIANNKQLEQIFNRIQDFEILELRLQDIQKTINLEVNVIRMIEEKLSITIKKVDNILKQNNKSTQKKTQQIKEDLLSDTLFN